MVESECGSFQMTIATSRALPAGLEKHPNVLTLPDVKILYKMESLPIKISISWTACMSLLWYIFVYILWSFGGSRRGGDI